MASSANSSPTVVRTDMSAEAKTPAAVQWPSLWRRIRSLFPPAAAMSATTPPKAVRAALFARGGDDPRGYPVASSAAARCASPRGRGVRAALSAEGYVFLGRTPYRDLCLW